MSKKIDRVSVEIGIDFDEEEIVNTINNFIEFIKKESISRKKISDGWHTFEEREEKDKYYLVLDEIGKGHCRYINYDKVDKDIFISNKTNDERYQTQFEDYEMENLRKKFPKLVGIATKVKAEE